MEIRGIGTEVSKMEDREGKVEDKRNGNKVVGRRSNEED